MEKKRIKLLSASHLVLRPPRMVSPAHASAPQTWHKLKLNNTAEITDAKLELFFPGRAHHAATERDRISHLSQLLRKEDQRGVLHKLDQFLQAWYRNLNIARPVALEDINLEDLTLFIDKEFTELRKRLKRGTLFLPEQIREDIQYRLARLVAAAEDLLNQQIAINSSLKAHVDLSKVQQAAASQEELPGANKEEALGQQLGIIWNHLTISRNQTSSSDFKAELLLILRASIKDKIKDEIAVKLAPEKQSGQKDCLDASQPLRYQPKQSCTRSHTPSAKFYHGASLFRNPAIVSGLSAGPDPKSKLELINSSGPSIDKESVGKPGMDLTDMDASNEHTSKLRLLDRISELESENRSLKVSSDIEIGFEVVYFIQDDRLARPLAYQDEPTWAVGPRGEIILKAHFPIPDVEAYIEGRRNVAFLVGKFYSTSEQDNDVHKAAREKKSIPPPKPSEETIRLESADMKDAMEAFLATTPISEQEADDFDPSAPISAPYLFWYHNKSPDAFKELSQVHEAHMRKLTGWIDTNYGELYHRVDEQLDERVVTPETIVFLLKRGDAIVQKSKTGHEESILNGIISDGYPSSVEPVAKLEDSASPWAKRSKPGRTKRVWKWTMPVWSYKYDGTFFKDHRFLDIEIEADKATEKVPINTLSAYPLRNQRLVSYEDARGIYGAAERFMVDFQTYMQLHSTEYAFKREYKSIEDSNLVRMDPSVMEANNPPPGPEVYAFPAELVAYNLRSKNWVDLEVDMIREVTWNKHSFAHLVIDDDSKELVQALITNQIAREQGTDIIESKGNGLIILLHGGPGTGKTFTAESVAEMAEKPLFRVTCGDIGTKPEEVEKYLESVLHLSKSWGCVVLLDEADVFLEQRTLTDLERNALVSVFLRVLEYYEGILILTSNRVGTFDEAFKSRIQLSLHYENLGKRQRKKIWKNFLTRLRGMDGSLTTAAESGNSAAKESEPIAIDFDDIDGYVSELADIDLNGRQIRNAITTARQLAKFKKEKMKFRHLQHVIQVSSKFDRYLQDVHEGVSDDMIARDGGVR
ncbi:AAA family ATPase [Stagonosporopsis vannaccii]|nr:AAA family ATPase [Stagonosporopsis vannaccii]